MDLDYIKTKFHDKKIEITLLRSSISINEENEILVENNIDSYINCLNTLNIPIAFLIQILLDESNFYIDVIEKDEDEDEGEKKNIDLLDFEKGLEQFKCYIGESCIFDLSSLYNDKTIRCLLYPDWYSDFLELRKKAVQQVEELIANEEIIEQKKLEEIEEKRMGIENDLLNLFESLVDDQDLRHSILKGNATVRTISLYALKKFPELRDLDDESIKSNISLIRDTIKASVI